MRVSLLFVVIAAVGLLLAMATGSASATQGTLRVDSGTAFVGEDVSVGVLANVAPPGLGTWTVDITYDSSVVSATGCTGTSAYSVCSTTFGPETVLVTGAHTPGLIGDVSLATFTFRCDRVGTSQLSISVRVFADATPDAPQDINAEVQDGAIGCVEPSVDTNSEPGVIRIGSASANVGDIVSVDIVANVGPPGLGAWTVDPIWDPSVLSPVRCVPYHGGVCSMNFGGNEGRVTGGGAMLVGETKLATLFFQCADLPGISPLELSIEVFADATPDSPQDIDETVTEGAIACVEPAVPPGVIQISTAAAPLGELAETAIVAVDIPPPGLGAWAIDVQYDPDVIKPEDCTSSENGACNLTFARDKVRVTGASATGIIGGFTLATITFRCGDQSAMSALHLSEEIFTTAGVANPHLHDLQDGFVRCFGPDAPGPTATPAPALPVTGQGGTNGGNAAWPAALLVLAGVAFVLAAALRRRA